MQRTGQGASAYLARGGPEAPAQIIELVMREPQYCWPLTHGDQGQNHLLQACRSHTACGPGVGG